MSNIFDGATHYHLLEPGKEGIDAAWNKYFVFELGECECCGGPVQEVNGFHVQCYREILLKRGLKPWDLPWLPPEIDVHDDGSTFCEDCQGGKP